MSLLRTPDAAGMLNISEGKNVPLYTKDAIKVNNIGDLKFDEFNNGDLIKWKYKFAKKIQEQFKDFDFPYEEIEGYIFKDNSAPVKRIKESKELKRILVENKSKIFNIQDFSGEFDKKADINLKNAFGKADFKNKGFDKEGNLHLYMFDTYDFNKGENALIEAGRRLMMNKELKGFFTIHEVIIPREEVNEILK